MEWEPCPEQAPDSGPGGVLKLAQPGLPAGSQVALHFLPPVSTANASQVLALAVGDYFCKVKPGIDNEADFSIVY